MLRGFFKLAFFTVYSVVFGWILVFLLIEIFPDILNVVQVEALDYLATYDRDGFRKNSSEPPYDIAVIGDSYIETGESDETTFTEFLKRETDLSVLNLGRGWYGPYQYLELLKRYVLNLSAKPRYVFFCFFAGNDFDDMKQYENWKAGGQYYFYKDIANQNIISRFRMATQDTLEFLRHETQSMLIPGFRAKLDLSKFGIIGVKNKNTNGFALLGRRCHRSAINRAEVHHIRIQVYLS